MRAVGNVVAGGVVAEAPCLPTGRPDVDLDAVRARREAEAARRAATNPFARPSGQPRSASTARALGPELVNPAYVEHAFATPAPAPKPDPVKEEPVTVPKPTPRPAPAAPRPTVDAAGIVRDHVEASMDVPAIALARSLPEAEVQRILDETPGVTAPETNDAAIVEQIRRLYVDEGLSQRAVAERLRIHQTHVSRLLRAHDIPTRPFRKPAKKAVTRHPSQTADEVAARTDATPAAEPETASPSARSAVAARIDLMSKTAEVRAAGLSDEVVNEIYDMPTDDGLRISDDLLKLTPKEIENINQAYSQLRNEAITELAAATRTPTLLYTTDLEDARQTLAEHSGDLTADDVDDLVSALHDADIARTVAHSLGATTPVLDAAVRRATDLLDVAVRHELETVRLLQETR